MTAGTDPREGAATQLLCDVLVVGGGLGGIVAAARAAELKARVLLIETRDVIGGTALFSGGGVHIWGARSWEEYREHCPNAEPIYAKQLFDNYEPLVEWLLSTKAPGRFKTTTLRGLTNTKYQLGKTIAPHHRIAWFRHMVRRIEALGSQVLLGTRATGLLIVDGRVVGATAQSASSHLEIHAKTVILAAGGFQSNSQLLSKYVASSANAFVPRAVAADIGEGLQLALAAGGTATRSMDTIYGHLMPAPPCFPDWNNYLHPTLLSAFYGQHGILVNARGERFVDEGNGELTGLMINAAAKQPPDGLWIVMDENVRRRHARYELPSELMRPTNLRYLGLCRYFGIRRIGLRIAMTIDSLRFAIDRGAICLTSNTFPGLIAELEEHGVDGPRLSQTVSAFNASVREGQEATLAVPRTKAAHLIERAPFYALKVSVGVSMTYGGVHIDTDGRVINQRGAPVEGLYAIPGTAGGIHELHYAGALAACGVYGKIAAEHVAAHL